MVVSMRYLISFITIWFITYLFLVNNLYSKTKMEMIMSLYDITTTEPMSRILTFNDNPDCLPLNAKVLLYNRIFKTGSTSTFCWFQNFSSAMKFSVDFSTTEDYYDKGISHPYPGIIANHTASHLLIPNVTQFVFMAHFYFRNTLKLASAYTYINQVREPVKRVISHYFYIHRSKERPGRRLKKLEKSGFMNESFEDCLHRQHNGCQGNVMTRFFCGKHSYCKNGVKRALCKAKKNIRRYYAAVGLLEHLEIYLKILQKRFPSFIPSNATSWVYEEKVNHLYNISEVSMATIQLIKRLNSADLKLYEFIKERFWSQAKACKIIP